MMVLLCQIVSGSFVFAAKLESAVEKDTIIPPTQQQNTDILSELMKVKSDVYRIGASDKFDFQFYDDVQLNCRGLVVRTDGQIALPLIGDVKVEGLTVDEAKALIEKRYQKYYKQPVISLLPVEVTSGKFTIIGKVVNPGTYSIQKDLRLLDAFGLAGGLAVGYFKNNTVEMADLEHSFIIRDGKILPVDFLQLVKNGNTQFNIPLKSGDYIYIPSARNMEVYLMGEVGAPEAFLYREDLTLSEVLSYAEGFKKSARLHEVRVIRGKLTSPELFKVNVNKILAGKAKDFRLQPGDLVFVPKSYIATWNDLFNDLLPSLQTIYMTKKLTE